MAKDPPLSPPAPERIPDAILRKKAFDFISSQLGLTTTPKDIKSIGADDFNYIKIITQDKRLYVLNPDGQLIITRGADGKLEFTEGFRLGTNHAVFKNGNKVGLVDLNDFRVRVIMEEGEGLTLHWVKFSGSDLSYIVVSITENNVDKARIYKIPDISKPVLEVADIGRPKDAELSDNNRKITFVYAQGPERTFELKAEEAAPGPPIRPSAEPVAEKALAERINSLNPESKIEEFIACVKSANSAQLDIIIGKFKQKEKAKIMLGTVTKPFWDAVVKRREELKAQEAPAEEEIELAPEPAEEGKPEKPAAKPEAAKPSAERPAELIDFLKKAMEAFRTAKTSDKVDKVLEEYGKGSLVKGVSGLEDELNDMAKKRKEEIRQLDEISKRLDSGIDSVMGIEKGARSSQQWHKEVKEAEAAFYDGIEQNLEEIVGKERFKAEKEKESSFYREIRGLIIQTKGLFKVWYNIIYVAVQAKTFSELANLQEELKANFERFPLRMKAPQAYINRRKDTLTEKQNEAIEKMQLIAADAGDEYIDLDRAFVDYNNAITALKTAAEEKTKFDDLSQAASQAEDIVTIKMRHGIRVTKIKRRGGLLRRFKNPWKPLEPSLKEAVAKRTQLIERLWSYAVIKRDIDKFSPAQLYLTQKEFDEKKDAILLQTLEKGLRDMQRGIGEESSIIERYKRYKDPAKLLKLIKDRDQRYLQPLGKKLKIEFRPLPDDILTMEEVKIREYLQLPNPASTDLKVKSKTQAAIDTQA